MAVATLSPLALAGVHTVDGAGQGSFTTIQAAIDAAVYGDLLLVKSGNYIGFTLDGKSLALAPYASAAVSIQGMITIQNAGVGQVVCVSGINIALPVPTGHTRSRARLRGATMRWSPRSTR